MSLRTASSRSSKWRATMAESRSSPRVSCVRSLEPIDMPSKYSRKPSASSALVAEGFLEYLDRKSTRLNSSHEWISYAVFCLKKKKNINKPIVNTIQHDTTCST